MRTSELRAALLAAFPDASVEVDDLTGTEDHYQVRLVSAAFSGMSRIARHRAVHEALGAALAGEIHALALSTHTPSEWERQRAG